MPVSPSPSHTHPLSPVEADAVQQVVQPVQHARASQDTIQTNLSVPTLSTITPKPKLHDPRPASPASPDPQLAPAQLPTPQPTSVLNIDFDQPITPLYRPVIDPDQSYPNTPYKDTPAKDTRKTSKSGLGGYLKKKLWSSTKQKEPAPPTPASSHTADLDDGDHKSHRYLFRRKKSSDTMSISSKFSVSSNFSVSSKISMMSVRNKLGKTFSKFSSHNKINVSETSDSKIVLENASSSPTAYMSGPSMAIAEADLPRSNGNGTTGGAIEYLQNLSPSQTKREPNNIHTISSTTVNSTATATSVATPATTTTTTSPNNKNDSNGKESESDEDVTSGEILFPSLENKNVEELKRNLDRKKSLKKRASTDMDRKRSIKKSGNKEIIEVLPSNEEIVEENIKKFDNLINDEQLRLQQQLNNSVEEETKIKKNYSDGDLHSTSLKIQQLGISSIPENENITTTDNEFPSSSNSSESLINPESSATASNSNKKTKSRYRYQQHKGTSSTSSSHQRHDPHSNNLSPAHGSSTNIPVPIPQPSTPQTFSQQHHYPSASHIHYYQKHPQHLNSNSTSSTPLQYQQQQTKSKNVRFSSKIIIFDTYDANDYDRQPELATCNSLNPFTAQQIKQELNDLKMEMEVAEASRVYTHFFA